MNIQGEIKMWAFGKDAPPPSQDHELTLISLGVNELLLELASDGNCPKQREFLSCLYLLVGDAVMTDGQGTLFHEVEQLLELGNESAHPLIEIWIERSRRLLKQPDEFDYRLWCGGELAKTP